LKVQCSLTHLLLLLLLLLQACAVLLGQLLPGC
jgi:hypothetical protein